MIPQQRGIMNPTEIILLTALVNIVITGLISGVAVHRIRKKMENSFAEKLEEFRAVLRPCQDTTVGLPRCYRGTDLMTLAFHRNEKILFRGLLLVR
jgi:hypothetical protein